MGVVPEFRRAENPTLSTESAVCCLSGTTAIHQKRSVETDTFRYRHRLCNVLETSCTSPRMKGVTMLYDTRYPML